MVQVKMIVLPLFASKNGELLAKAWACLSHLPACLAREEKNLVVGKGKSWVGRQKSKINLK